jgi:hypothetical protein
MLYSKKQQTLALADGQDKYAMSLQFALDINVTSRYIIGAVEDMR